QFPLLVAVLFAVELFQLQRGARLHGRRRGLGQRHLAVRFARLVVASSRDLAALAQLLRRVGVAVAPVGRGHRVLDAFLAAGTFLRGGGARPRLGSGGVILLLARAGLRRAGVVFGRRIGFAVRRPLGLRSSRAFVGATVAFFDALLNVVQHLLGE